jgi:hypothetical protein
MSPFCIVFHEFGKMCGDVYCCGFAGGASYAGGFGAAAGVGRAYYNANKYGWNYAAQKQIDKQNAQFLEVKWVFPIPANPGDPNKFFVTEGVGLTPLVYRGVV